MLPVPKPKQGTGSLLCGLNRELCTGSLCELEEQPSGRCAADRERAHGSG
jgi:hypothetical protein